MFLTSEDGDVELTGVVIRSSAQQFSTLPPHHRLPTISVSDWSILFSPLRPLKHSGVSRCTG